MTLTPSTIRTDLKCGKGAISQGEKCRKGPATQVAAGAAIGAAVLGAGALALAARRRSRISIKRASPTEGMDVLAEGTRGKVWVSKDRKTVTKTAKSPKAASALLEEARIQTKAHKAGVSTPQILSINSSNKTVTMENLQDYKPVLTAAKGVDTKQKAAYAKALVVNLSKAHAADIAHGDLNTNVLARDGKLSIIDWGQSSKVRYKGMADILNAIRIADDLDPTLAKTMKQAFKPLQSKFSKRETLTVGDFNRFYADVLGRRDHAESSRLDLKCGKGSISKGEKCHKGPALSAGQIAGAAALTLGAGALTAYALTRGRRGAAASRPGSPPSPNPSGSPSPRPSAPRGPARLTGAPEPYGLLPPGRRPKSKTQRMRENTTAAMRQAEGAIGQTAREEVRRIGQIGNTMASVGEATGMATKTAFRELRLRAEAARRQFEPGYRRSPIAQPQPPAQLAPGNDPALELPFNPQSTRPPEAVPIDPRTGQPRRRRATGFGPRRDSGLVSFGHPVYVDPAR